MSWPFPFYVSNPFLESLPSLGAISVWCPDLIPSPRGKKNSRLHAREFSFWMVTPQDFRHNFQYFELLILVFIIDTGKEFLSEGISWLLAKQNELSMSEWMPKGERGVQLVEVIPLNFETVFFFCLRIFGWQGIRAESLWWRNKVVSKIFLSHHAELKDRTAQHHVQLILWCKKAGVANLLTLLYLNRGDWYIFSKKIK